MLSIPLHRRTGKYHTYLEVIAQVPDGIGGSVHVHGEEFHVGVGVEWFVDFLDVIGYFVVVTRRRHNQNVRNASILQPV